MGASSLVTIALLVLAYATVSRRLSGSPVTAAMGASRIDLGALRREYVVPLRFSRSGLPFLIAFAIAEAE